MCTRRNHIYCWVMKKEYKKPGLRMGDFLIISWVFLRMPELKDEHGWPRTLLSCPTLLYSSPILVTELRVGLAKTDGWDGMMMGWDDMEMMGWDDMMVTGWDSMRMMGWENMRLTGWENTMMT